MVKRKRKLRQHRASNSGPQRPSKSRKKKSFKERFYTSAIWALGLINLVLITSKVSEFFISPNESFMSAVPALESSGELLADKNGPTGEPVKQKRIQVEVLNACGVKGLAIKFTEFLRDKGFDVVNHDNYVRGGKIDWGLKKTTVLDRVSLNKENAAKVGEVLGVDQRQIQPQLDDSPKLQVTLLLGRDYKKLKSYQEIQ
jgi:hypothetical protein